MLQHVFELGLSSEPSISEGVLFIPTMKTQVDASMLRYK